MSRTRRLLAPLALAVLVAASSGLPAGAPPVARAAALVRPTTTSVVASAVLPVPSAALTKALAALRATYGIPGIQATVIYSDGRSWTSSAGRANVRAGVAVAPATPFAVGSVTKTFVAALILQLVAEGRLTLDQAAGPLLPGVSLDPRVTIRELLSHRSGVYDFFSNPRIDPALLASKRTAWTTSRVLSYVRAPYFEPDAGWHYSNTNYVLLGLIAQRVTGSPLASLVRARFLNPLRLSSAFWQGVEGPRSIAVAHAYTFSTSSVRATPVDQSDGSGISPFRSVTTAAGAAGALAISSWDLARWARALYAGSVLPPDLRAEMESLSYSQTYRSFGYGLGFETWAIGGYTAIGHGGQLIGTRAVMRYFPELGISIAVTTNQWRTSPDTIVAALVKLAAPAAGAGG